MISPTSVTVPKPPCYIHCKYDHENPECMKCEINTRCILNCIAVVTDKMVGGIG